MEDYISPDRRALIRLTQTVGGALEFLEVGKTSLAHAILRDARERLLRDHFKLEPEDAA